MLSSFEFCIESKWAWYNLVMSTPGQSIGNGERLDLRIQGAVALVLIPIESRSILIAWLFKWLNSFLISWDTAWSKEGASTDPCNELYCGSKAFSEIEIKQMAELIETRKGRTAAYFAFHSFSEFWMYPWGYTHKLPPNAQQLVIRKTKL